MSADCKFQPSTLNNQRLDVPVSETPRQASGWLPPGQQRAAAQDASERVGRLSGVERLWAPPLQHRQLEQRPPAGSQQQDPPAGSHRTREKTPGTANSCRGQGGGWRQCGSYRRRFHRWTRERWKWVTPKGSQILCQMH